MTPKEKAEELVDKYHKPNLNNFLYGVLDYETSKQCALISVNEIISQWEYIDTYLSDLGGELNINLKYWQEVKQEIEKL